MKFIRRLFNSNLNTQYAEFYWEIAPYLDENWYKNSIICQDCGFEQKAEFCESCGSEKVLSYLKALKLAKDMW